ncbi:MAG: hypoxanthine phosphoribosyltransferase [Myxococcaceae bacterium]|nr:hypoxanthine phosphoribosyltransferase [Myxococcaceae bacterium]MBH2006116.1 hypoxanthine phosphoribosyltransferase [Myxococcaceae bacterium]
MPTVNVLISEEQLQKRIAELGKQISEHYQELSEPLVLIGVLKGSFLFLADLCRQITLSQEIEFMGVSSYGEATKSSGVVQITQDLTRPIQNRHVLIVEDIVDTGLTARYLLENLRSRSPASLSLCSLLEKPTQNNGTILIDFCGFQIPDRFVVGYGLDWSQTMRNLPFVGVVE